MILAVDANVLISALIASKGKTRELLFSSCLSLFAPQFLLEEMENHKAEITSKSGFSALEFEIALASLFSNVEIVEFSKFAGFIPRAAKISPDPHDIEYLALALSLHCPLWSNDRRLSKQKYVKVISTNQLVQMLVD